MNASNVEIAIGTRIDFDFDPDGDLIEKWRRQYKMFILFC